jgi:FMN-dependent NADH-azoreductase
VSTLLRIDASARSHGSQSRILGDAFEQAWLDVHNQGQIVRRDLAHESVAQINAETITGFYTPADEITDSLRVATQLSDRLIEELVAADEIVVTTPMYNFTIPAALKAWIDQIVRIGQTFSYDGSTFTGLVTGKRATIAIAYGASGYAQGGSLESMDFVQPYLRALFGFLGFTDIRFVAVEATTGDKDILEKGMARALRSIASLAAKGMQG